MPTGIIINSLSIILGGVAGGFLGHHLKEEFKTQINIIFAICSMGMGIASITQMKAMPAVVFAIVIGTSIGLALHFGDFVYQMGVRMQKVMSKLLPHQENTLDKDKLNQLVTIIVLFCISGTGIYGSLEAGMTGDSSLLISKSILDFFTAAIFATNLGFVVSSIALPQFVIFYSLFLLAKLILPLTTPDMIADFKACGGFLMLATGFRIANIKLFPSADMIPAMILILPCSWIWTNIILPLL